MKKKLAFVILAWNSEKHIGDCLQAIFALTNYRCQVVVVDNGSTDGTTQLLRAQQAKVPAGHTLRVLRYARNIGTTRSRNAALSKVDRDAAYICVLDSDTRINQAAMDALVRELETHPDCGMAGPRMVTSAGVVQLSGRNFPTVTEKLLKGLPFARAQKLGERMERPAAAQDDASYPVDYLMSACWLLRPEVVEKAGVLDEKIFYAPEDAEYCLRVWKAGYQIRFCPQAQIIHEWQRLSKKKLFSRINWEHIKGLMYMFRKHHYWFRAPKPARK